MRKAFLSLAIVMTVAVAIPAFADLQNVEVGGSIRIRGSYWSSSFSPDGLYNRNPLFQGPLTPSSRPVVNPLRFARWAAQPGRLPIFGVVDWSDDGPSTAFVEQRTKLNVKADFTEQVSAFIELDSYDVWGEDFRSNYITGVDARAATANDVEVYQAYIEANEMFGYPLRLRIGRQDIVLGSGWLVSAGDAGNYFTGHSFDAIRLTYATDMFSVDAIWAKLAESGPVEEDGDVDMYALYGSYLGLEDIVIDAYWILVRDARAVADTYPGWFGNWIEDVLDVDDYDVTNLHTIGLRGAGTVGAFDFEAEVAYQFGDAGQIGGMFAGAGLQSPYGDDDADFSEWGANLIVGYTFDSTWSPRVYLGAVYLGGHDDRDVSFWEWLGAVACPFWSPQESYGFNRLFSGWEYTQFVDGPGSTISNLWAAHGGVIVHPTEALTVSAYLARIASVEPYRSTWPNYYLLGTRVTWLYPFSWIDQENDDLLVWETGFKVTYAYSEDLTFELGYAHMFLGDGAIEGSFNHGNGLAWSGGTDSDKDPDYIYLETKLCF